jgi:hypothetical protein
MRPFDNWTGHHESTINYLSYGLITCDFCAGGYGTQNNGCSCHGKGFQFFFGFKGKYFIAIPCQETKGCTSPRDANTRLNYYN